MTLDALRTFALSLPHATEDQPFGPDVLTFKVGGKLFAVTDLSDAAPSVAVKAAPEAVVDLRERYAGAERPSHFHPAHWVALRLAADLPADIVREAVAASHALVVAGLTRARRAALGG